MSRKITPADWASIVTDYQRGDKGVVELAEDYGVSHQTISRGLRERNISRSSPLTETVETEDDIARKEREARVSHAKLKEDTYSRYNDAIAQMVMKRIIEGDRNGNLKDKNQEILVLKNAQSVVGKARREMWEILRVEDILDEDEKLPDLIVGEYSQDELEEIRARNEEHYLESEQANGELDEELFGET